MGDEERGRWVESPEIQAVENNYYQPWHVTGFTGPSIVQRYNKHLSLSRVRHFMAGFPTYTRFRRWKKVKAYNPIRVYYRRQMLQVDLIDVT